MIVYEPVTMTTDLYKEEFNVVRCVAGRLDVLNARPLGYRTAVKCLRFQEEIESNITTHTERLSTWQT